MATWAAAVTRGLVARGHAVQVYARERPGLGHVSVGCPVHPVSGPSFGRYGGRWIGWAAGRKVRPGDRVLATTWPVATGVLDRCQVANIAVDVVAHGSDVTRPPVDPQGRQQVLRHGRWWAASRYLASQVSALGSPCAVLPCPIDGVLAAAPDPSPRWIFVGRATPWKGGDRVIRLAAAASVELDVVGDGDALPEWRALADALGGTVRFHGQVPRTRVAELLRGAHVALLLPRERPDRTGAEGFGLALAEAAAHGVATVGCATGGVPEAAAGGLVLDDPDDVAGSVAAIGAWWSPTRGVEAHAHLVLNHGVHRVISALDAPGGSR